jgi:predicted RNase H-like nuclease (RuvC/YqgF family)
MSLQTNHNTTTASLQRELDSLRQENQKVKVQLRELEMGNDDLERNERAVASSLSDVEAKYARALEEKILLEHELLDKAHLEEECQRLKDELRGTPPVLCSTVHLLQLDRFQRGGIRSERSVVTSSCIKTGSQPLCHCFDAVPRFICYPSSVQVPR